MSASIHPPVTAGRAAANDAAPRQDLIDFPTRFPIKVMGAKSEHFVHAVTEIVRRFDPGFDAGTVELRDSSGGKYLSVTVTVNAQSREQLDAIYRALTADPQFKYVL